MNEVHDIIIVGAGIAGCFAALEAAKQGASVLLIEKGENAGTRPFVEFLLFRDYRNLELNLTQDFSVSGGFVNVTGNKINSTFDYPDKQSNFVYMKGTQLVSKLLGRVKKNKNIALCNATHAVCLLKENDIYKGVVLPSGEKLYSKITILCTGLNSTDTFAVPIDNRWPAGLKKFKQKIKVSAKIPADQYTIQNRFQTRTYEFYKKDTFDFYMFYPFDKCVCCEGFLTDISEEESIKNLYRLMTENSVALMLLKDSDLNNLEYNVQRYTKFGVSRPTHYPGLLIAGDAMNIHSPAYITHFSIYYAALTGKFTGGLAKEFCEQEYVKYDLLNEYEKRWSAYLMTIKYDFDAINDSIDQFDVFGKSVNLFLTYPDLYYPEIRF